MSYSNQSLLAVPDATLDYVMRDFIGMMTAQLPLCGMVQTADGGQLNPYASPFVRSNSAINNNDFAPLSVKGPKASMDGTTASGGCQSLVVPTVGSPAEWVWYAGDGNTFALGSVRIFTNTLITDPKDWTLDYSTDYDPRATGSATWNSLAVTSPLPSGTSNNNMNLSASGVKAFKARFTSIQGAGTTLRVAEIQFWSGTNGTGTQATASDIGTTVVGTNHGYQMYKFNDWYQNNSGMQVYLKLEYLTSATNPLDASRASPALAFTVGTGSNGSGTITGQIGTRQFINCNGNMVANDGAITGYACSFSGEQVSTSQAASVGRLHFALFHNHSTAYMYFTIERQPNTNGTDSDIALTYAGGSAYATNAGSNSARFAYTLPKTGALVAIANDLSFNMPLNVTTAQRGLEIGVFRLTPFLGKALPPLRGVLAYFNSDISTGTVFTATEYGSTYSYLALGGSVQATALGGATTSRIGIRI